MNNLRTASLIAGLSLAGFILLLTFYIMFIRWRTTDFRDVPIAISNHTNVSLSISAKIYSDDGFLRNELRYTLNSGLTLHASYGLDFKDTVLFSATDSTNNIVYNRSFTGKELWDTHGNVSIY